MRNQSKFLFAILMLFSAFLGAQSDNSESPYFLIEGKESTSDFPLKNTEVKVTVSGPMADVHVKQVYKNNGTEPIEAVYIFPSSTRAAVYHMQMVIGDRIVKAKIEEKNKAKSNYIKAKEEGKRASLLEQHRPNVFQMNVANILPGDQVEIEMFYTEFLLPENQEYSFVFPTVVGPRFTGGEQPVSGQRFAKNAHTKKGVKAMYSFDLTAILDMSIPINYVSCPSHRIHETDLSNYKKMIELHPEDYKGGNRDFILRYKLAGDQIAKGIQTFDNGKEKFFLCQMEAPNLDCDPEINPREYIFIVDVSGSMSGFPLTVTKDLMRNLLGGLRSVDKFNIMFFAGNAFALSDKSLSATPSNIKMAFQKMNSQRGGGGTQMLPAIQKAMSIPKESTYSRNFVIVTDGYVTVEEEAFSLIASSLGKANFFAFGIGGSVNRHLIEGLAHVGRGEAFVVTENKYAKREADRLRKYISHPVLTDIKIKANGIELYDLIPAQVPDLMAARPIFFFGKYRNANNASLTIKGSQGQQHFEETVPFPTNDNTSGLDYLWAREKIRLLDDFNTTHKSSERMVEITNLGLKYNLLTKYTSFLAIDESPVVQKGAITKKLRQVLPMPQGVSNSAIGFELEIDELVDTESISKTIEVDVSCENEIVQHMFEIILELMMQNMSSQELKLMKNTEWIISLTRNATFASVNGGHDIPESYFQEMQRQFHALGIALVNPVDLKVRIFEK